MNTDEHTQLEPGNGAQPLVQWNELVTRLRTFIKGRVPENDVDDVLQDVALRMHQNLHKLRERDHLAAWMFRIARNAVADLLRKRSRDPARPVNHDEAGAEFDPIPPDIDETSVTVALAEALGTLIDELPERYRDALHLTEIQGRSQQEMADELGLSLSGAKSRVQRGRQKLRALIETCCRVALDARGNLIDCEPRNADAGCCE